MLRLRIFKNMTESSNSVVFAQNKEVMDDCFYNFSIRDITALEQVFTHFWNTPLQNFNVILVHKTLKKNTWAKKILADEFGINLSSGDKLIDGLVEVAFAKGLMEDQNFKELIKEEKQKTKDWLNTVVFIHHGQIEPIFEKF